jgi:DNA-binding transcriptional regulator YiaG
MSTFAKSFKDEVIRLARHEAKVAIAPVRKPAWAMRLDLADLKRRVAALEKETRRLAALLAKVPQPEPVTTPVSPRNWISGKGVRSLRQKLGLSQEAFAKLVGVTPNGVYNWESKSGMLRMRDATKAAVFAVRQLGAREAKQKLAEMAPVKTAKKGRKAGKKAR